MGGYSRSLVIAQSARCHERMGCAPDEVPLVLIESAPAIDESRPAPKHNLADLSVIDAQFFQEFSAGRLPRGLSRLDTPARRIPVGSPVVRSTAQQQESPALIE